MTNALLGLSRSKKRLIALSVDALLCVAATWAAFYLRMEEWILLTGNHWLAVLASVAIAIPLFIRFGLYRAIFRHTGWPAMIAVVRACLVYGAVYSLIFTFIRIDGVPRTVGLIQPALLFLLVAASRVSIHYLLGRNYRKILGDEDGAPQVLIYGAGEAGRQLASAMLKSRETKVVGFLDDDPSLQGATFEGLMIYDPRKIGAIAKDYDITGVLLALPSASRRRRREILDVMRAEGLEVRTLPGLMDLAHGRIQVSDIRPLEIEDLLGRDPVPPNRDLLERNISDKVVMVTGAGGSIGAELCRQILALRPAVLLLLESSEFALYTIHRELIAIQTAGRAHPITVVPLLGSVQDEERLRDILTKWRTNTIYHAAAYKHVPLVEQNPIEGIRNNIQGTAVVARLAAEMGVSSCVLISTDKAVRPTNVMGATKRVAEMVLQAYADTQDDTCFSIVRFGNVLGSSGSVVPLFRQQIAEGGPVTVTHPEVTRYFMTIAEAGQLVIQAGAMARGGEVFVLDMGEPVLIHELAVNMIELSGMSVRNADNPEGDMEISVVGLRPGEKLYEELLIGNDPRPTQHERILQAREQFLPRDELLAALDELERLAAAGEVGGALAQLRRIAPDYSPSGAPSEDDPAARRPASGAYLRVVGASAGEV
jgi:FlaA1/EpsC-like NDP-sugar epimerase